MRLKHTRRETGDHKIGAGMRNVAHVRFVRRHETGTYVRLVRWHETGTDVSLVRWNVRD